MEGTIRSFYDVNDIRGPKVRRSGLTSYMSFLSFTCARNSKGNAGDRRLSLGAQSDVPPALTGLVPDAGNPFRFTWWNPREGDAVWIEHRGHCPAGIVVGRGRERVMVAIAGSGGRCRRVRKFYSESRRRR